MVIDDVADRRHDADLLLDQNLHRDAATRYDGLVESDAPQLLGPEYALLRAEFGQLRESVTTREGLGRLLVFFGGADALDATGTLVRELPGVCAELGLEADVVVGEAYSHQEELLAAVADLVEVTVHVSTPSMAHLMASADLAVGAAGSTSWERACLGLPSILVATAGNQVDIALALDDVGAAVFVATPQDTWSFEIVKSIRELADEPVRLSRMSEMARRLTDGRGAARVAATMEALL
jgi:UDP-2,4-diacetamido-2,4,6-trideoxy-beta-L-altropyranose hydrolase